jgi:dihydroorotate dehydrogenase (fumarate)
VRRLEDAGASAIVMHSLFEEQLAGEQMASVRTMDAHGESFAEATSMFPDVADYALGPDAYLERIREIKQAVRLPVVASLNGSSLEGWLRYAGLIEQAGADALELNVYHLARDPFEPGDANEKRLLEIVREMKKTIALPIAVKLAPFFSSIPHFATQLAAAGASGVILFNRFYQPDIDVEALDVVPTLQLSDSSDLLLRIRWLAMLSGRVKCSLAASGGVHTGTDAIKAVMAGADAVQLVAALLKNGPQHLRVVREHMVRWMEEHEYQSISQMRGSMSHERCPDPAALERANYLRILQGWRTH